MTNTHRKRLTVDSRKRVTLGALAEEGMEYIALRAPDGLITLHPVPIPDLDTYHA